MSAKRSTVALSASSRRIRQAKRALKTTPQQVRVDLMVQTGVMTTQQADNTKAKLAVVGESQLSNGRAG